MKNTKSILFLLIALASCADGQVPKNQASLIPRILELTRDEMPVYVSLKRTDDKGDTLNYLFVNLEFHSIAYQDLDVRGAFIDSLQQILENSIVPQRLKGENLDHYLVSSTELKKLQGKTVGEVKEIFFTSKGIPKASYSEETIKSVAAFLIEHGVMVHQRNYSKYYVYVKP